MQVRKTLRIKRYSNRKLYLDKKGEYITLTALLHRVKSGWNINVIDHTTKRDITQFILSKLLRLDSEIYTPFKTYQLLRNEHVTIHAN